MALGVNVPGDVDAVKMTGVHVAVLQLDVVRVLQLAILVGVQ
jgi:hypothetical protein